MKKVLSVCLMLLLLLSSMTAFVVYAEEPPRMTAELQEVLYNASEDELIPVKVTARVDYSTYVGFYDYFDDEFDIDRWQYDEAYRNDLNTRYKNEVIIPHEESIDRQLAEIFTEVFGTPTPQEVSVYYGSGDYIYRGNFFFTSTKDKIYKMNFKVELMEYAPELLRTPEETQFIKGYLKHIGEDEKYIYGSNLHLLGKTETHTLFMYDNGAVNDGIACDRLGDVTVYNTPMGNYENLSDILTCDSEGRYSTLTYEFAKGRIDIHEVYRALLSDEYFPCVFLDGDLDRDGYVTVKDATRVQKIVAGIAVAEVGPIGDYEVNNNVDGEGGVTVKDATYIQRLVAEGYEGTNRYYFYLPIKYGNAGIYWSEGKNAQEEYPGCEMILERQFAEGRVFYADVPKSVEEISFNDYDGNTLKTVELTPEGTGKIFICSMKEPGDTSEEYEGEWYYYYGNGEFGFNEDKVEGDYFTVEMNAEAIAE